MNGAVPPIHTSLVAWRLIKHVVDFNLISTSATSIIRTRVATNTNTNIGFLKLYVLCIIFQCADKATRCNTSYE